jgi:hypothetical protein
LKDYELENDERRSNVQLKEEQMSSDGNKLYDDFTKNDQIKPKLLDFLKKIEMNESD